MTEGAQVNNVQLVTRGRGTRDSGDQPDLSQLISQSRNIEIISPDPGATIFLVRGILSYRKDNIMKIFTS